MTNTKHNLVKSWFDKGKRDLITAQQLIKQDGFRDIICYHAQQAVEKFLKTYLIFFDIDFPKTHDLENLLALLIEKDPSLGNWFENAAMLSSYAVEIRYPGFDIPTIEDSQKSVSFAEDDAYRISLI